MGYTKNLNWITVDSMGQQVNDLGHKSRLIREQSIKYSNWCNNKVTDLKTNSQHPSNQNQLVATMQKKMKKKENDTLPMAAAVENRGGASDRGTRQDSAGLFSHQLWRLRGAPWRESREVTGRQGAVTTQDQDSLQQKKKSGLLHEVKELPWAVIPLRGAAHTQYMLRFFHLFYAGDFPPTFSSSFS